MYVYVYVCVLCVCKYLDMQKTRMVHTMFYVDVSYL